MSKRESIEEFLARGGTITKCEPGPLPEEQTGNRVMPTPSASATMMSLAEGSLFYSESRAKIKERKKKSIKEINTAALPACLLKFVTRS